MNFWRFSTLFGVAVSQLALVTACNTTADRCASLTPSTDLLTYNTTILNTTYYAKGELDAGGLPNEIPFCEVYSSVSYGDNDTLIFTLWLPDDAVYGSRFMAVGNGGFAGVISYREMMVELNSGLGLAVAGSDAGHQTTGSGLGAPGVYEPFLHDDDRVSAWLRDGISFFTPPSKELISIYYGREVNYSYFTGCSAGGAQGFSLAQLYPDMFDGIIAGGHTNWFTRNMLSFLWNAQHTGSNETTLSQPLLDFMQSRVIEKCDLNDGVRDSLIENPLDCEFDIHSLACDSDGSAENSTCLTPVQISAVEAVYQGPVRSDDPDVSLYPGISLGSEAGWALPIVSAALSNAFAVPLLQNLVYDDLQYDASTFNWASDVDFLDARAGPLINAINTDLSSFRNGGSKMIAFAGWADPNIAPEWSLQHIEDVTKDTIGQETAIEDNDFLKLVMIPGGGHCGANIAKYPYVPASYGFSSAIIDWVEKNTEPLEGIKSWGPTNGDDRTRRLCTWPRVAKLNEGGNLDDWESYTCG